MIRSVDLDEVDSTMFEAERQIEIGTTTPLVISARSQTGGHGRFGRSWVSTPGNLYWTAVVRKKPSWPKDFGVTFASGLAVRDSLLHFGVNAERIKIKWPNDTLVDGRKISGVLARASTVRAMDYIVIGIGINVKHHPETAIYPATDLNTAGVFDVTVENLRDQLTKSFFARLSEWEIGGFTAIRADYYSVLHGVGEPASVSFDADRTQVVNGISRGIDLTGALLLEMPSGDLRTINAGDVLPPL